MQPHCCREATGCSLTGIAPGLVLPRLESLTLDNNAIDQALPDFAAWTNLYSISMQNNKLKGPLPPTWANLASLSFIWLGNNQIDGRLPGEWSTAPFYAV